MTKATNTFLFFILLSVFSLRSAKLVWAAELPWWDFQAIDTMKYSRDPSRQFLSKPSELAALADQQVRQIAETGATHVAIATPYDDEFFPVMQVWVSAARKYNLHVWFRGNWSGWETWFGYPRITRQEHLAKTREFILRHTDLFESGDVFSACPECENGGPGDPRLNGDASGHRKFLIDEYTMMQEAFKDIGKNVQVNYNSMNGDVARLIMDKPTTQALGGIVVVDHYVETPEQLNKDITDFAERSGGKVVLGEFGAPIPDIHGHMTDEQQANWLNKSFQLLTLNPHLTGMSYWTNVGGSTSVWQDNGQPKAAVNVITSYYSPKILAGRITNSFANPIKDARVETAERSYLTDADGYFKLPYISADSKVTISSKDYNSIQTTVSAIEANSDISLIPVNPNWWYQLRMWWKHFWQN